VTVAANRKNTEPRELIRRFCASYQNLYRRWRGAGGRPQGVTLQTPQERPLTEADLPERVRRLVAEYRGQHPGRRLTFVKHLRTVDGEPVLVVEDDSDLPAEDVILTASQTVTLNSADSLHVVTDVFVARID
jgi:hypothetical protein